MQNSVNYKVRPLFTTKATPDFLDDQGTFGMISIPLWLQYSGTVMDDVVASKLLIQVEDPSDTATIDEIIVALATAINDPKINIRNQYSVIEENQKALDLLDLVFYVVIMIMMFLCFFSLQASMTTNMYNQSKEIAVLRSIGFTSYRISTLYFYEALLLVFASCLLGVLIGVIVGITMVIQQDMFLNLETKLFFPWKQTLEILLLSILCAILSTYGPATQLNRKQIAAVFRMT